MSLLLSHLQQCWPTQSQMAKLIRTKCQRIEFCVLSFVVFCWCCSWDTRSHKFRWLFIFLSFFVPIESDQWNGVQVVWLSITLSSHWFSRLILNQLRYNHYNFLLFLFDNANILISQPNICHFTYEVLQISSQNIHFIMLAKVKHNILIKYFSFVRIFVQL